MSSKTRSEAEILKAAISKLSEQGYDVIVEPSASLLPPSLKGFRPDAIAIGREPKLVVEVASDRPQDARVVNELQQALKNAPGWKLHLVLDLASVVSEFERVSDVDIMQILDRALTVGKTEPRASVLLGWAALEALSRERKPDEFSRPQSPGRIIEQFASQGIVSPSEAAFLRTVAHKRNAFIHGDLLQAVTAEEVAGFVELLKTLVNSPKLRAESGSHE